MLWNNHGWGLREMLFLSAILLFFVFFVAIFVNQLYQNLDPSVNEKIDSYQDVENHLRLAAQKYRRQHPQEDFIFSDDLLQEEYLTLDELTYHNDICEGYVLVEDHKYLPFIQCAYYESEDYAYE